MAALRTTTEGNAHAAVLHIVYGRLDPFVHTLPAEIVAELGREFAPLARYTDEVEVRRVAMARNEALAAATRDSCLGLRAEEQATWVQDLARHRERVRWADRVLSSGDALRAAFAPPRVRTVDESKEQYREHVYLPHRDARDAFLTHVKLDANRMLTSASLSFKDAWLRRA